jgi:hypothetical protein
MTYMGARCAPVQTAVADTTSKRALGKLSADATMELEDLEGLEEEELTIRRDFSPRSPAKVAIDTSDSDATWKWRAQKADEAGRHVGLALPTLDGSSALEWDRDDVEKTLVWNTPFALAPKSEVIALLKPRRRPLPIRPVESTAQLMAMIAPPKKTRMVLPLVAVGVASFCAMWLFLHFTHVSHAIVGVGTHLVARCLGDYSVGLVQTRRLDDVQMHARSRGTVHRTPSAQGAPSVHAMFDSGKSVAGTLRRSLTTRHVHRRSTPHAQRETIPSSRSGRS